LDLPLLVILFFKELLFLSIQNLLAIGIFHFSSLSKQEGFLETCPALFSLILKLAIQSVVDHVSLVNGQFSSHLY